MNMEWNAGVGALWVNNKSFAHFMGGALGDSLLAFGLFEITHTRLLGTEVRGHLFQFDSSAGQGYGYGYGYARFELDVRGMEVDQLTLVGGYFVDIVRVQGRDAL
jgi:hypothetical protein